jgi:putative membrane protein
MEKIPTPQQGKHKYTSIILWLFIIVYFLVNVVNRVFPESIPRIVYTTLCIFLPFFFAIIHGIRRYGIKNLLVFLIVCLVISNFYENLSIMTGFPFGDYYYSANLGPKIFLVPFLIGFAYFATGYLSWVLAEALIGAVNPILKKGNIFFVPLIAAFAMASWDFTFDPFSSTMNGDWVWLHGGGFFGVPFGNFLGWLFCVFTFYQIFGFYLSRQKQESFEKIAPQNKNFWYQAALFYAFTGIDNIFVLFTLKDSIVTDPAGRSWHTNDIYYSLALTTIFTMFFIALLSAIRIKENDKILTG